MSTQFYLIYEDEDEARIIKAYPEDMSEELKDNGFDFEPIIQSNEIFCSRSLKIIGRVLPDIEGIDDALGELWDAVVEVALGMFFPGAYGEQESRRENYRCRIGIRWEEGEVEPETPLWTGDQYHSFHIKADAKTIIEAIEHQIESDVDHWCDEIEQADQDVSEDWFDLEELRPEPRTFPRLNFVDVVNHSDEDEDYPWVEVRDAFHRFVEAVEAWANPEEEAEADPQTAKFAKKLEEVLF